MARSDLVLRIGADLSALQQSLKDVESRLKRFSYRAERVGRELTTRITLPVVAIGAASVATFAKFDKLQKGLSAIAGSAGEGERQFKSLLDVVKDTRTTLDLQTAATVSLQLQAVGISAERTENTLRQLAIAATLSGNSADDVGEVGRQLAQAAAKGNILQQELRIILERIPALAGVIKNEFGTVTAEGLRDAGVSADEFISRLTAAIETNQTFQNIQGGLSKAIETFGIEVQIAAGALGQSIANTINLEENLGRLSSAISRAVQGFQNLNPATQKAIIFTAGLAAAVGPLSLGLGAVARSLPLLRSGFALLLGPIGGVGKLFTGLIGTLGVVGKALFSSWGRAVLLAKGLSAIRVALAFLTGPIGIAVAVITTLAAVITKGYRNSQTFRDQINLLIRPVVAVGQAIGRFLVRAFESIGVRIQSVGGFFSGLITILAGTLSAFIEFGRQLFNVGRNIGEFFANLFTGNFSQARQNIRNLGASLGGEFVSAIREKFVNTINEIADSQGQTAGAIGEGAAVGAAVPTEAAAAVSDTGSGPIKQSAEAVKLLTTRLTENQRQAANTALANVQFAKSSAEAIKKLEIDTSNLNNVFDRLKERYSVLTEQGIAFGSSFDVTAQQIEATKAAIVELTEQGFSAASREVTFLTEKLDELQESQQEKFLQTVNTIIERLSNLGTASSSAFDAVTNAMQDGISATKAFGQAVLQTTARTISAFIKEGVAAAAAKALATVPFPLNIAAASAAGAGASILFNALISKIGIPALADGGIATGPTLALIGEGRSDEAIIPLDRIDQYLGDRGGSGYVAEARISGEDLLLLISRAQRRAQRVAG